MKLNVEHRVAIVVDRTFGQKLAELAETMHVWICDSPANSAACEFVWRSVSGDHKLDEGATRFNCLPDTPVDDVLLKIIDSVDLHHGKYSHSPPWSTIEVFGCAASPRVRVAFAEYGAELTELAPKRFNAHRRQT